MLIRVAPFAILLCELLFDISAHVGDRSIVLCAFMTVWMVTWWIGEVLPLGVTALIPLIFLPMFGLQKVSEVSPHYANPVIYLFLGGFVIARALEKTQLDERIALNILAAIRKTDTGIITGFVITTAFLSMWISNTATTVMMVPIALSVMQFLKTHLGEEARATLPAMTTALLLAIAYAANIGGIMTPIGTPPNVVFLGYLDEMYSRKVDFWRWGAAAGPVAIVLLALMIPLLKRMNPFAVPIPVEFKSFIKSKLEQLGPMLRPQHVTIFTFAIAASLWIFKDVIHYLAGVEFLNDTSIAILAGVLLFLIPTERKGYAPVLTAPDISYLPWNIVLLFGGGMAMAGSLERVGVIKLSTEYFAALNLGGAFGLVLILSALALILTEFMSNVALCVVALPMIMKLGEAQGLDPLLIAMPAALATSFAFSMPISTPPNAIVFGTEKITVREMVTTGIWMNIFALTVTMTLGYVLIGWLLV